MLLDVNTQGTEWMERAACASQGDPEVFFTAPEIAKAICAGCPVVAECAIYGAGESYGVWGGEARKLKMTAEEREERNASIVALSESGASVVEMSQELGINPKTISNLLAHSRVEAPVSAVRDDEIRQRYADGQTITRIAREAGLSRTRVTQIVNDGTTGSTASERKADRQRLRQERAERVRQLANEQAMTAWQIIKETGYSTTTVYGALRQATGAA